MNQKTANNTRHPASSHAPKGIAYLLGRLDHLLNRQLGKAVAPFDMTVAQYTALSVLRRHGQMSNAQLAERSMVSPQSANGIIKSMQHKGWVQRESATTHGRIINLCLTPAGCERLKQCDAAVAQVERSMLAELSEVEQATLHAHLRDMLRGLGKLTTTTRANA